jgi:thiamine-phosphate pyrophosphorylase
MKNNDFGLYVIITKPFIKHTEVAEICVKHNIKYIQLREKQEDMCDRDLLQIAKDIKSITNNSDTKFIINDRIDICMLANADGLHLGQDDIMLDDVKKLITDEKIIGLSTHNIKQAENALKQKPDYIGFGPIYATPTKKKPDPVVGITNIKNITNMANNVPVVAIGGIDDKNINEVINAGARNVCLVRYLMNSNKREFEEKIISINKYFTEI